MRSKSRNWRQAYKAHCSSILAIKRRYPVENKRIDPAKSFLDIHYVQNAATNCPFQKSYCKRVATLLSSSRNFDSLRKRTSRFNHAGVAKFGFWLDLPRRHPWVRGRVVIRDLTGVEILGQAVLEQRGEQLQRLVAFLQTTKVPSELRACA